MKHISIAPTAPLAEFIERFWYSSDAPPHQKVRIVPNGTMELVFNLDEDELGIYDTEHHARLGRYCSGVRLLRPVASHS